MGRCHFQEVWMQEDQHKTWLACVSDVTARCTVCLKTLTYQIWEKVPCAAILKVKNTNLG